MEAGEPGAHGRIALYLVEKENKTELEPATVLILGMAVMSVRLMVLVIEQSNDAMKTDAQVC